MLRQIVRLNIIQQKKEGVLIILNKNFGETREMPNKKAKASKQRRRKLNDSLKKLGRTAHQVKKIRDRSRNVSY